MHRPYKSINEIPFDSPESEVIKRCGSPDRTGVNSIGLKELDYGESIYRFDSSGKFVEVTVNLEELALDFEVVQFGELEGYLTKNDVGIFNKFGFLVSPKFGLAFDPDHKHWVTFFRETKLEDWRNI
ncbi:hypothetical protein [Motilimonas eburnea]|uniref:hypothetical protein n=1 Tax=Motilimonas eburnea TaxID=1737488 RepID=UPI001E4D0177|nr:hypothetical protein [Motilimonas eburnea]MCE2573744.1 hypothetical protein [Motilimonas eburnea]